MAISEDLRGVQAMLGSILTVDCGMGLMDRAGEGFVQEGPAGRGGNEISDADTVRRHLELALLLCDNLSAIADQVEALEALPLTASYPGAERMPDAFCPALAVSSAAGAPLQ